MLILKGIPCYFFAAAVLIPATVFSGEKMGLEKKEAIVAQRAIPGLLSELERIEKIIDKQNQASMAMEKKQKNTSMLLEKLFLEERVLDKELQAQRSAVIRRMRTIFPYRRSQVINYILAESYAGTVPFFRAIQLFRIISKKDIPLIAEYKRKWTLSQKKNRIIS